MSLRFDLILCMPHYFDLISYAYLDGLSKAFLSSHLNMRLQNKLEVCKYGCIWGGLLLFREVCIRVLATTSKPWLV